MNPSAVTRPPTEGGSSVAAAAPSGLPKPTAVAVAVPGAPAAVLAEPAAAAALPGDVKEPGAAVARALACGGESSEKLQPEVPQENLRARARSA